jgi:hypothetical protein
MFLLRGADRKNHYDISNIVKFEPQIDFLFNARDTLALGRSYHLIAKSKTKTAMSYCEYAKVTTC